MVVLQQLAYVGECGAAARADAAGQVAPCRAHPHAYAQAHPVIAPGQRQHAAIEARGHAHATAVDLRLQPVCDCVLDQRLQRQRRQRQRTQRLGHIDGVAQAVFHADLHDAQISLDQIQLLAQRALLLAQAAERGAQVLDERLQHQPRARRISVYQAEHIGQDIEPEVRFGLALQQLQLCFGDAPFGIELAVA